MSARMGIYQEQVYKQHGKHPSEALFFNVSISNMRIVYSVEMKISIKLTPHSSFTGSHPTNHLWVVTTNHLQVVAPLVIYR